METFTLTVTPAQLALLETKLQANGETLTTNAPNKYTITGHHVNATAVYDPPSQVLTVTIVSKPFYISDNQIQQGLQKAVAG
jgi:hypothetical protein